MLLLVGLILIIKMKIVEYEANLFDIRTLKNIFRNKIKLIKNWFVALKLGMDLLTIKNSISQMMRNGI